MADDKDKLEKVVLTSPGGSTATVSLYGAHVVSYKHEGRDECIFVSRDAVLDASTGKAIRGGIPVCFPQFSDMGACPKSHGFARNRMFTLDKRDGDASATLLLEHKGDDSYRHPFQLRVTVTCQDHELRQSIHCINVGSEGMDFTAALHAYFLVSDIEAVQITGLHAAPYLDNLTNRSEKTQEQEVLTFDAELDRIYKSDANVKILDPGTERVYCISTDNFPDKVVWNPWTEKVKTMDDFGNDEYRQMVCVEPALAASGPVRLEAGQEWSASLEIRVRKLK